MEIPEVFGEIPEGRGPGVGFQSSFWEREGPNREIWQQHDAGVEKQPRLVEMSGLHLKIPWEGIRKALVSRGRVTGIPSADLMWIPCCGNGQR